MTYFICYQSNLIFNPYSFGASPFGRNFDRPIPSIILPYILFILTIRVKQLDFAFHKYINIAIISIKLHPLTQETQLQFQGLV